MKKKIDKNLGIVINALDQVNLDDVSLMVGKSGVALFYAYAYRTLNDELFAKKLYKLINDIIISVDKNIGMTHNTYCNGLIGIGWLLQHLKEENLVSINNNSFLSTLVPYARNN